MQLSSLSCKFLLPYYGRILYTHRRRVGLTNNCSPQRAAMCCLITLVAHSCERRLRCSMLAEPSSCLEAISAAFSSWGVSFWISDIVTFTRFICSCGMWGRWMNVNAWLSLPKVKIAQSLIECTSGILVQHRLPGVPDPVRHRSRQCCQ